MAAVAVFLFLTKRLLRYTSRVTVAHLPGGATSVKATASDRLKAYVLPSFARLLTICSSVFSLLVNEWIIQPSSGPCSSVVKFSVSFKFKRCHSSLGADIVPRLILSQSRIRGCCRDAFHRPQPAHGLRLRAALRGAAQGRPPFGAVGFKRVFIVHCAACILCCSKNPQLFLSSLSRIVLPKHV